MKTQRTNGILLVLILLTAIMFVLPVLPQHVAYPPDAGVIDVTKPPYYAKGDGVSDDTAAINRALKEHNSVNAGDPFRSWTIYFPAGTYLVSDTLQPVDPENATKVLCSVRFLGAGKDASIIRLTDHARGFANSREERYIIRTGALKGAQANAGYGNYIQHLTVDAGRGNPGAVGIRFDVANCGSMDHVRIISKDTGIAGLGFYTTAGIGFVRDVSVEGFTYGIYLDSVSVNNIAFEHIRLKDQKKAGICNVGKNIQVRDLKSQNDVPALISQNSATVVFLLDAVLSGSGDAAIQLVQNGFLYARDVVSSGYGHTVVSPGASMTGTLEEWVSHRAPYMNGSEKSLRLPVKDAPEYYNDDFSQWANVTAFGATVDQNNDDDAPAIQRAIDSGKEIVYFPRGVYTVASDVIVRKSVKRIDFLFSSVKGAVGTTPVFHIGNVKGEFVILENFAMNILLSHESAQTVVIRNKAMNGSIRTGSGAAGNLFVEVAGPHTSIEISGGIQAWLRAINRERPGFLNDGSTVWYYADNIERMQNKNTGDTKVNAIKTVNGGTTEIIGATFDAINVPHPQGSGALVVSENSTISACFAGEIRANKEAGGWGGWDQYIRESGNAQTVLHTRDVLILTNNHLRAIVPLYRTPGR